METLSELIERWQSENNANCMEGATGVRKLEELCKSIGYKEGNFIGSEVSIWNFLADNSGAIEALIGWIGETDNEEWKENLASELPEVEEEEPEDE